MTGVLGTGYLSLAVQTQAMPFCDGRRMRAPTAPVWRSSPRDRALVKTLHPKAHGAIIARRSNEKYMVEQSAEAVGQVYFARQVSRSQPRAS